jgi:hypothetical protein
MAITIVDGDITEKMSDEVLVYQFSYADRIAADVDLASAGTCTLDPDDAHISKDNEDYDGQTASLRISGGKPGKTYVVRHSAATTESPAQTVKALFYLFIRPEQ